MKLTKAIEGRFGKERAALYEVELEHLVEKGYTQEEISALLETYATPLGIFDILSMIMRSRLSVKDLEKSLFFLLNRHVAITETLSEHLKPDSRILDFGCGRGLVACSLALKGYEVHGVDVSTEAIGIAKKLAHRLGCRPRFHLIKENELPFPDEYFDAVLCVWTLHEVSQNQLPKLSEEMYRALRKIGSVFMVDQEGVAPIDIIKDVVSRSGFKLEFEKNLLSVYDHGRTSQALMLKYIKGL